MNLHAFGNYIEVCFLILIQKLNQNHLFGENLLYKEDRVYEFRSYKIALHTLYIQSSKF